MPAKGRKSGMVGRLGLALALVGWMAGVAMAERGRVKLLDRQVLADDGQRLRGTAIHADHGTKNYAGVAYDYIISRAKARGLNTVRVFAFGPESAPDLDAWVEATSKAGLYMIVCYQTLGQDDQGEAFWTQLAGRWKDRNHVIYELDGNAHGLGINPGNATGPLTDIPGWYAIARARAPATHIICKYLGSGKLDFIDYNDPARNASVGYLAYITPDTSKLRELAAKYPVGMTQFQLQVREAIPAAERLGAGWTASITVDVAVNDGNFPVNSHWWDVLDGRIGELKAQGLFWGLPTTSLPGPGRGPGGSHADPLPLTRDAKGRSLLRPGDREPPVLPFGRDTRP